MSEATADESVEEELTDEESEQREPAGKSGLKRILLFSGIAVLLIAGLGAGAYFGGLFHMFGEEEEAPPPVATNVVFYDLPEMVVNVNAGAKRKAFLKIQLSLELDESQDLIMLERLMPRIVDHFQVYLRELRTDDLHGSAGIYRLKEELLRRITVAAYPVVIRDVLFKEMLIQ